MHAGTGRNIVDDGDNKDMRQPPAVSSLVVLPDSRVRALQGSELKAAIPLSSLYYAITSK